MAKYTDNYQFPLYEEGDLPNLLDQSNGATIAIDSELKKTNDAQAGIANEVSALGNTVETHGTQITKVQKQADDTESLAKTNESDIKTLDAQMAGTEDSVLLDKINGVSNSGLLQKINVLSYTGDYLGFTKEDLGKSIGVYYTNDLKYFNKVGKITGLNNVDYIYSYKINGVYYFVTNSYIYYTEDFNSILHMDVPVAGAYGICLFEGKYIAAIRQGSETFVNDIGSTTHYFKFAMGEYTVNSDGSLNFGPYNYIENIPAYVNDSSIIDPFVYRFNDSIYVALKDEKTCTCTVYKATNLADGATWERVFTTPYGGVEAPKLFSRGNSLALCVSAYSIGGYIEYSFTTPEVGETDITYGYPNRPIIFGDILGGAVATECRSLSTNRHMSLLPVDSTLRNIFALNTCTLGQSALDGYVNLSSTAAKTNKYTGILFKDMSFVIGGSYSLTVTPAKWLYGEDFHTLKIFRNTASDTAGFYMTNYIANPLNNVNLLQLIKNGGFSILQTRYLGTTYNMLSSVNA